MRHTPAPLLLLLGLVLLTFHAGAQSPDLAGVKIALDHENGAVGVSGEMKGPFRLRVIPERNTESGPRNLRVELPVTGPKAWPVTDVVARDAAGNALLVQRSGIEWEKLSITLAPDQSECIIEAVEPADGWPVVTSEKSRTIEDATSGTRVRIATWPEGRRAALSIRFDDSHTTHLSKAIPILREYGFRGTFMVNPGPKEPGSRQNFAFETRHDEWSAVMARGDQELANHSAHHRGATGDVEMESEIGTAAQAIWAMMPPGGSRLTALNLGGGTRWETSRPLRYYLEKFHHFDASSGSLGMDDVYGGRVEAFQKKLEQHLERGLWCRIHYHYIGEGLSSSEANFRAVLDIAREHEEEVWIAGMADIYKYQTERSSASLVLAESGPQKLSFHLKCATDPVLYDEPLTIEIEPSPSWNPEKIRITDSSGNRVESVVSGGSDSESVVVRVRVAPKSAEYSVAAVE
jgi:hypothetical protein